MTSITEQTRSVSKSARALNSIMSSLSQVLDENSSNGKQIAAIYDKIGESMYDTNGQIKSGYDLLGLLSKHWGELNKNDQLAFANLIAGKNQLNSFLALMNNWDHAVEATTVAMESQGSAMEENERYMGGIQAKISGLKQSFQDLSRNIINSDIVKGILDIGTSLLNGLNTPAGQTLTTITLLTGALVGLGGMMKAGHIFDTLKEIVPFMKSIPAGITKFVGGMGMASKSALLLTGKIGLIAAAVGGTIALIKKFGDDHTTSYEEATEQTEKLREEEESLMEQIEKYKELEQTQEGGLTDYQQRELDYLEALLEKRRELREEALKDEFNAWQREEGSEAPRYERHETGGPIPTLTKTTASEQNFQALTEGIESWEQQILSGTLTTENMNSAIQALMDSQGDYNHKLQQYSDLGMELDSTQQAQLSLFQNLGQIMNTNTTAVEKFGLALTASLVSQGIPVETAMDLAGKAVYELNRAMESAAAEANTTGEALEETGESAKKVGKQKVQVGVEAPGAKEAAEDADGVTSEVKKIPLSWRTQISTLGAGAAEDSARRVGYEVRKIPDLKEVEIRVTVTGDKIPDQLAEGSKHARGGPTLVNELGPELISANGEAYIAGGGLPTITNLPKGATVLTAEQTKNAFRDGKFNYEKMPIEAAKGGFIENGGGYGHIIQDIINRIEGEAKPTPPTEGPSDIGSGGYSGASSSGGGGWADEAQAIEETFKHQNQLFKDQIELLEHKLYLMEKEGASSEEQIEFAKKIQDAIEKQKQWYIDKGLDQNSKYIRDLEKQWWEYADKIKKLYKDQAKIYETLFGAVSNKAQEEIDALNKKKEAIQDQNDELEHQLELQKALDELARAKQQKVLVYKDGKMQYVQDADAVSEAQAEVERIQNERTQQEQLDAIDEQIKKWEEYKNAWGSVAGDYNKNQDLLLLEQKLGIKLEGENWAERLGNLQDYINKYDELMIKAGAKEGGLTAKGYDISGVQNASVFSSPNLYRMGMPTPASMMSTFSGTNLQRGGTNITIQNFNPNLPNVQDGQGFVDYLKNSFLGQTLQLATV